MASGNWIQKALPKSSKGKLHKKLGVPIGEKIPKKKLDKAAKASGTLGKEARLAKTLSKLRRK